jgi:FMN phosphatase YigB (HAD superfamily)
MKKLLVCDLDNTLYDWVDYFVTAFYAMVDEVVRITACDREQLLDDFRAVHRRHHDSEHPFALLETETIAKMFPGQSRKQVANRLDAAFHAFNATRKERLRLYPGVRESLDVLSRSGIKIVAHTESKLYGVIDRLTRLDITHYFTRIYCRERPIAEHPDPSSARRWLSQFPLHKVVELSHHQRKPSPDVLLEICRREECPPEESAYVGDSMARDMLMARLAGVFGIWAKYGTSHRRDSYEKLVRVTHWTDEDVVREREASAAARGMQADFILEQQFSEILAVLLPRDVASAVGPAPLERLYGRLAGP